MKNREPWNFCETPKEKCTMNYCDENGCQNRKRNYVQGNDLIADVSKSFYCQKPTDYKASLRCKTQCGLCATFEGKRQ
jgi:hypothetical protein